MALPLNIGGWGPREGVTAVAFGAVGLGAAQGLTTAVVYGVLSLIACLPGAVVLLLPAVLARYRRRGPPPPSGRPAGDAREEPGLTGCHTVPDLVQTPSAWCCRRSSASSRSPPSRSGPGSCTWRWPGAT